MSIVGINVNKKNPEYTIEDFVFWMPQFTKYCETSKGQTMFNNLYPIANAKIFYSIFGTDWKYAMSLCIAHYSYLISSQAKVPSGTSLESISGGGNIKGIMSSVSVGEFSKQYDLSYTTLDSKEAMFWNQSAYGAALMALLQTKSVPSIFVVTSNPIAGGR